MRCGFDHRVVFSVKTQISILCDVGLRSHEEPESDHILRAMEMINWIICGCASAANACQWSGPLQSTERRSWESIAILLQEHRRRSIVRMTPQLLWFICVNFRNGKLSVAVISHKSVACVPKALSAYDRASSTDK